MSSTPVVLDSDTLSELSRGNPRVHAHAETYLKIHGSLTITAVSVFERLRGYRDALAHGKPFQEQLRKFQAFVTTCRVLPVDDAVAAQAAIIWAALNTRHRRALGDILIAATASANGLPLVTRNRRDFEPMTRIEDVELTLADWTDGDFRPE
jgi:tRNA(fMet)-specific endonuclease VapC